jgi:hypothetical protein
VTISWQSAARGARVIPCALIAGLPVILIPEGVTLTGWTAGGLDAAWWPGSSFGGFSTYLRSWLSLADGVTWSERAQPVQPEMLDVSSLTINVSDIGLRADGSGGLATALFASQFALRGSWITADVSTADTTVSVADTTGFAASGYIYLGRETMYYPSKTSTAFAVGTAANRGKFGSPRQHHWYVGDGNEAVGNPQATDGAPEIIGRTVTVWLLDVSPAGVVTSGMLAFYGVVGGGVVMGEAGEVWQLRIDHALKRLGTPLRGDTVQVAGYVHAAPRNGRGTTAAGAVTVSLSFAPTSDYIENSTQELVAAFTLTTATASPDNSGYHATPESYVNDLSAACVPIGARYRLVGGKLAINTPTLGGSETLWLWWPWDRPGDPAALPTGQDSYTSTKNFPAAWVPIFQGSRVYLSAADFAKIPAVPSSPSASVYYVLAFGEKEEARYARITAKTSSGGVYYLTCDAVTYDRAQTDALGLSRSTGFILTEPSPARIGCYVSAPDWVSAVEAVIESFDTSIGETTADAFDFDDMRVVAGQYPVGPYGAAREYVVDLTESVLDMLTNECRLNGFALAMKDGRITITRITDFAVTEPGTVSFSTSDLHAQDPRPVYSRGLDGIVNAMRFESPQTGVTVNVVDATSTTAYGPGRTVLLARTPTQLGGTAPNPSAEYLRLSAQAMQMLAPLRYPYESVSFTTTLARADIEVGDLAVLTLWRVPDQRGGRGITGRMAQIVGREHALYDGGDGRVTYTARLSPTNLAGWAPSALAASISGADITLDTTTFGTAGFGPTGSNGGAEFFSAGDKVRLVEIGNTSPTASSAFTVTGTSGSVVSVTPNPSATWVSLAAGAVRVMLIADDWSTATATQQRYAYLAPASYRLDSTTRARVYAP